MKYKTCQLDEIIADAKAHGHVEELKAIAKKTYKNKKGEKRQITFLQLRREYFEKFYPEELPVAGKKETMWDKISAL